MYVLSTKAPTTSASISTMPGDSAIVAQSEETDVIVKRGLEGISGENVA